MKHLMPIVMVVIAATIAFAATPPDLQVPASIPQDLAEALQQEQGAATYGLLRGVQAIQAELNARGSSMNAGQVIVASMRKSLTYQKLVRIRARLISDGVPEADPIITAIDARIADATQ